MRLLSDAFRCLLCSSLPLACCLAYKPQGNRLSQSKFFTVPCWSWEPYITEYLLYWWLKYCGICLLCSFCLLVSSTSISLRRERVRFFPKEQGILKKNSFEDAAVALSIQGVSQGTLLWHIHVPCGSECSKKPYTEHFKGLSIFTPAQEKHSLNSGGTKTRMCHSPLPSLRGSDRWRGQWE